MARKASSKAPSKAPTKAHARKTTDTHIKPTIEAHTKTPTDAHTDTHTETTTDAQTKIPTDVRTESPIMENGLLQDIPECPNSPLFEPEGSNLSTNPQPTDVMSPGMTRLRAIETNAKAASHRWTATAADLLIPAKRTGI